MRVYVVSGTLSDEYVEIFTSRAQPPEVFIREVYNDHAVRVGVEQYRLLNVSRDGVPVYGAAGYVPDAKA